MTKIAFERLVRADRGTVFCLATDYARLAELLPEYYPSVRVLSSRNGKTVTEEHRLLGGRELVITARHTAEPPGLHRMDILGGDAKGSRITERYEPATGGTMISIDADIRMGMRGLLSKGRITDGLKDAIDGLAGAA
ncbi:hypothetical protein CENSYa_0901 [Cenarchaeum symbiosum A]|uniref:Polyketide cyclase/dehydrase n=1 Tax=Cenarchaeum symbiosum (strain A) TaxID=414004 RepID=A0RW16_CENSY|nr:hypothetical protein CENSYa_0901 [Cenarchaeum symbiosum A]